MTTNSVKDKQRCSAQVYPNDRWGSFHPHQCEKTATVQRDGRWYCKVHDPEYIKAKEAKQTAKWNIKDTLRKTELTAFYQCQKINPENPLAVAESIGDMYEAFGDMYEALRMSLGLAQFIQAALPENEPIKKQVKQIEQSLAKAKGKE